MANILTVIRKSHQPKMLYTSVYRIVSHFYLINSIYLFSNSEKYNSYKKEKKFIISFLYGREEPSQVCVVPNE